MGVTLTPLPLSRTVGEGERFVEGAPYKQDRGAKYRQWAHEFAGTNYTFAMPVVYTWYPTFTRWTGKPCTFRAWRGSVRFWNRGGDGCNLARMNRLPAGFTMRF